MYQTPLFITVHTAVRAQGTTAVGIQHCARRWPICATFSSSLKFPNYRQVKTRATAPRFSNEVPRWKQEHPDRSHSNPRYKERRNAVEGLHSRQSGFSDDDPTHVDPRPRHKEYNRRYGSTRDDSPSHRFDDALEYGDDVSSAIEDSFHRHPFNSELKRSVERSSYESGQDGARGVNSFIDRHQKKNGRREPDRRWSQQERSSEYGDGRREGRFSERVKHGGQERSWEYRDEGLRGRFDERPRRSRQERTSGYGDRRRESRFNERPRHGRQERSREYGDEGRRGRFDERQRRGGQERSSEYRDEKREGRFNERRRYGDERSFQEFPLEEPTEIQEALAGEDALLYGLQSVWQALKAERRTFHTLYLQHAPGAGAGSGAAGPVRKAANAKLRAEVEERAGSLALRVVRMDRGELNALCGNRPHQGAVLRCGVLAYEKTLTLGVGVPGDVVLALDEVSDPQNVGALLRSSTFLGARAFAVCARNSAPLSPAVSRASAGAAEITPVLGIDSMPRFLRRAREDGWRVLGAAAGPDSVDLRAVDRGPPTILVLGSEGDGLRTMVRQCCSALVSIKRAEACSAHLDSLNVSVAGALALYHLLE